MRNPYEVLGVAKDATEKQIKTAYRKLAKKYHPDSASGGADADAKFKEVGEAYEILGNEEKRKLYDKYGEASLKDGFDPQAYEEYLKYGRSGAGFGSAGENGNFREFRFDGGNLGDLFADLFGGGGEFSTGKNFSNGNPFGGFSGGEMRLKGSDVVAEATISFDEAVAGCERAVTLKDETGSSRTISVKIPAGIDDGQKVRFKGMGGKGVGGGENGDLYLKVRALPRAGFERRGTDVFVKKAIPFTVATFGGEVLVPTLDGNAMCKIRPGTKCGTLVRLKGKGIVSMRNPKERGDEYVEIGIEVPNELTERERKALKEFERATAERSGK